MEANQQSTSKDLFTHLHSCNVPWCTLREEQLETNINEGDTMMMELHERYLVWKFLLLLPRPYRRWAPGSWWTCEHTVPWWQLRKAALHFPFPPLLSPSAQLIYGPRWTSLTERCCVIRSSCQVPPSSAAMLLLELNDSSAPLYLSRISMCSFFSSSLCPFSPIQFSLNFTTAFLPSGSVHPHSSTLTLNGKVSLSVGNADNRLFHN